MDSSPLIKAHDHARAAAAAARQASASDTTVAINEHTLAAGEFANAAKTTSSVEALRTLKLLEEHHRRLAEILKLPPERTSASSPPPPSSPPHAASPASALSQDHHDGENEKEKQQQHETDIVADAGVSKAPLPTLAQRYATREMTSSIASNLASARGIRSKYRGQPLSPSVSIDQAPGNVEAHQRRDGSKATMQNIMENNHQSSSSRPAWAPPLARQDSDPSRAGGKAEPDSPSQSPRLAPPAPPPPVKDDGYARFYSTFGNLMSKISAPLAFAGLPLIQEESPTPTEAPDTDTPPTLSPTTRHTHIRSRISAAAAASPAPAPSAEPDLSKIYSRATLRALARDGHGPADSFYVVPSTGHTMSYANILSYAEKEKRRSEAATTTSSVPGGETSGTSDNDDAGAVARRRFGRPRSDRELHNMIEELSTENRSLKDMLDKLTKRLHTFEASAQSMALAESYRLMRPASPLASAGGKTSTTSDDLVRKNTDLEEQVSALVKQMERLEKDNRKMQKTLEKYREKWETLKAGAKARREAQATTESIEDTRSNM